MLRNRTIKRKLRLESLESRCLLAGNVTVKVAGGNLFITGDNNDNVVLVAGTGTSGQYLVEGLTDSAGLPTNIRYNGTNNSSVIVSGVKHSINVDLKGGDDAFGLTNANVKNDVNIEMGAGNDLVAIGSSSSVGIDTIATLGPVIIHGTLNVHTSGGNDDVLIGAELFHAEWHNAAVA